MESSEVGSPQCRDGEGRGVASMLVLEQVFTCGICKWTGAFHSLLGLGNENQTYLAEGTWKALSSGFANGSSFVAFGHAHLLSLIPEFDLVVFISETYSFSYSVKSTRYFPDP